MDLRFKQVKEEYPGVGSSSSSSADSPEAAPRPMEGLHDAGPPPFLTKTYEMVDDPSTDRVVIWSRTNNSFIVCDPCTLSMTLLPKYFKHNNFASFIRQLNTYGFRKVDPDRWEFANEGFLRGQKHLLKTIKRRRSLSHANQEHQSLPPYFQVGQFGLDGEVDRVKRNKKVLMEEMVKLRQEQQNTRTHLRAMEERLRGTELKQQQMMTFLARAMRNPVFLQQLVQQRSKSKELEETITKKRGRTMARAPDPSHAKTSGNGRFKIDYQGSYDSLALGMQGTGKTSCYRKEVQEPQEELDVELDDEFWEELVSEGISEEKGQSNFGGRSEEDVAELTERLEYLSSTSAELTRL